MTDGAEKIKRTGQKGSPGTESEVGVGWGGGVAEDVA